MNPYKAPNAEIQVGEHNQAYRRKYSIAINSGLFFIVIAIAVYAFFPRPKAMDLPVPETWEATKLIGDVLLFIGSTIIWITGATGFVYSDKLWQGLGYIRYIIAIVLGLSIFMSIGFGYFL